MMSLTTIKNVLQELKPELEAKYHVSALGLFGSVVRDDYTDISDIDIIVDFSKPIGIDFIDLADLLEKHLDKPVDLVSKRGIKEKYYATIESAIVYV
ncbi:MAG: nucleotidyltransferase domain-containing protein [Bacteroidota bacterium]|jgi:uncharacterized protein